MITCLESITIITVSFWLWSCLWQVHNQSSLNATFPSLVFSIDFPGCLTLHFTGQQHRTTFCPHLMPWLLLPACPGSWVLSPRYFSCSLIQGLAPSWLFRWNERILQQMFASPFSEAPVAPGNCSFHTLTTRYGNGLSLRVSVHP